MMRILKTVLLFLALSLNTLSARAKLDQDVTLTFDADGKTTAFQLRDLQKRLVAYEVTLFNPLYKRTLTYRAFKFSDAVRLGKIDLSKVKQISFIARDGYEAVLNRSVLDRFPEPWLAFEELNTRHGETFTLASEGKEMVDPGPFYLLWQQPDSYRIFPWPYAVTQITLNTRHDPYFEIQPKHNVTARVKQGFDVFKTRCVACHSINLVGGAIGPELNIPKNITEYRTMSFLKAWIKDPTSFRARSRMANFGTVTDKQIDDVLAYIQYMKNYKAVEKLKNDTE